jgi:hypothetical protein
VEGIKTFDLGTIDPPENYYWVKAVAVPDFNGQPVITLFIDGYPWAVLEWTWEEGRAQLRHYFVQSATMNHAETMINVGVVLGELSENAPEEFFDDFFEGKNWPQSEGHVWSTCVVGEGHGATAAIDDVVKQIYGTTDPTDAEGPPFHD